MSSTPAYIVATTAMPESPPRRTTRRGVVRRAQILAAATTLFLENGYSAASVDAIVKAVGGSKTNVYSQFGGKEGLFIAVVQHQYESFLHNFLLLDVFGLAAQPGLTLLGNALLDILLQDQPVAFQRLIWAESGRYPALGKVWFDAGPQRSRGFIADFIRSCQRAGELGAGDAMYMATMFHSMLVFNPVQLALLGQRPSAAQAQVHVDAVVRVFLNGCARSRTTPLF